MNTKKIITLILISVGIFVGIVLPSKTVNDLNYVSKSSNLLPDFSYWNDNYIEDYGNDSTGADPTNVLPVHFNTVNFNIGESGTFYLYINKYLWEQLQTGMYNLSSSYSNKYPGRFLYISSAASGDSYVNSTVGLLNGTGSGFKLADNLIVNYSPSANADNSTYYGSSINYKSFNYDNVDDLWYTSFNITNPTNVQFALFWQGINPDLSQSNIMITKDSSFSGWVNYVPYNQPIETKTDASINDVYIDKSTVLNGDTYNVVIDINNPDEWNFYSVEIDNNEYKIDTSQCTNDVGDEYIVKIPFTSDVSYGDIIHTVQNIILTNPLNNDYDQIVINKNVSVSSIDNFTSDVYLTNITLDKTNAYLTDTDTVSMDISNPSKISINGLSVNNKLYTNFIDEPITDTVKDINYTGNLAPNRNFVITNDYYFQKASDGSYNTTLNNIISYFNSFINNTLLYKYYVVFYDDSLDQFDIFAYSTYAYFELSEIANKFVTNDTNGNNLNYELFTWDNINEKAVDTGLNTNTLNYATYTNFNFYKIVYSTVEITDVNYSINSSLYKNLASNSFFVRSNLTDHLTFTINLPDVVGDQVISVDYIEFEKVIDKTYYSDMNINKQFNVSIQNPILLNDISVKTFTLSKTTAFSDDTISAELILYNPRALFLDHLYINNTEINNIVSKDDTNTDFTFNIPLQQFYMMQLGYLNITKLTFLDSYNGYPLENSISPNNALINVNLYDGNFASAVTISKVTLDKTYYLYGDTMNVTLYLNNPNLAKLQSVNINNINIPVSMINSSVYKFNITAPSQNYGNVNMIINSLTFLDQTLTKTLTYNYIFNYELYKSSDTSDVNILSFTFSNQNQYLFDSDQYLKISYSNPTNLILRSVTINNKEITNFKLNSDLNLIVIPVAAIKDLSVTKSTYTLNQLTFTFGDNIYTKNTSNILVLNVKSIYSQQINQVNKNYQMNIFNKIIYLVLVVPLLNFIFPTVDSFSIHFPFLFNIFSISMFLILAALITILMFKNNLKQAFHWFKK